VLDLAWADLLMWDGRKDGLEDQATGPIGSAAEMDMDLNNLPGRLAAFAGYRRMFSAAFGSDAITVAAIAKAIATYERTLVSNLAPFDRWIDGDEAAIPEAAKRGFVLFNGRARCVACHNTWRFTDDGFHDIGLPSTDPGRANQVPDEKLLVHAFKTPTLRNVAERGPYMHDGSVANLHDVVVQYDSGFVGRPSLSPEMRRLNLTAAETGDLIAFLHTLSSEDDPVTFPTLPSQDNQ
jgi:cytochrome c peroxidase